MLNVFLEILHLQEVLLVVVVFLLTLLVIHKAVMELTDFAAAAAAEMAAVLVAQAQDVELDLQMTMEYQQ
jgi:hypothetical protein